MTAPPQVDLASYVEEYPLDRLTAHPDNPHRADDDAIRARILASGFYGVIVATPDGVILAGHGRHRALVALGATTAPVWLFTGDHAAQLRHLLADNRAFTLGGYDARMLEDLLHVIDDAGLLADTLYNDIDLAVLTRLNADHPAPPHRDPAGSSGGSGADDPPAERPGPILSISGIIDVPMTRGEATKLSRAHAAHIARHGSDAGFLGQLTAPTPAGPAEPEPDNVVPFQSRRYH